MDNRIGFSNRQQQAYCFFISRFLPSGTLSQKYPVKVEMTQKHAVLHREYPFPAETRAVGSIPNRG